jgi:hypothetical protein
MTAQRGLLTQRGQVSANAAESQGSDPTAEAVRNLLLDLDHAEIPLSLDILKRHTQIFQKSQDSLLVFTQPIKQFPLQANLLS